MSDGQFSAKPIRSGQIREVIRDTGEFSSEGRISTDAARAFLNSPAVQQEIKALSDHQFSDIAKSDCKPLPRRTPDPARALGGPIASATLVQEYLIGLVFLRICGWMFLFFGAILFLAAAFSFFAGFQRQVGDRGADFKAALALVAFGFFIGGTGAWFGIFRGRVITEMCWFCPRGMIWMTDGLFEWYTWEQVPDVYCNLQAARPAIGISFGRNVSWISFSNSLASRILVERLEKQASAVCMPTVLEQFAEGKTIRFGVFRLSRYFIRDAEASISWHDVASVASDDREFAFNLTGGGNLTASLDEIPFPSLFMALVHASLRHMREQ
jgi:Family of unknown function (DUF6585)